VQLSEPYRYRPNDHAIYLDVKQYLANPAQGTHKAKQRNEIAGSTRKYINKKYSAAPVLVASITLFNGGGRVFGPQPAIQLQVKQEA